MKFLGSRKATLALVGIIFTAGTMAACLYVSGGEPEKYKALLDTSMEIVKYALAALGAAIAGQAAVDVKSAK